MSGEVTQILQEVTAGDQQAIKRLLPLVYAQLREISAKHLRHERRGHTLQPTALTHEAYLRLVGERQIPWQNRAQFLAVAARCMRQILINHANARRAEKRGGDAARVPLTDADVSSPIGSAIDVMDLEGALQDLAALDERQARVVELRFFAGMGVEDVAEVLGISPRTVEADWRFARAWLRDRLGDASGTETGR